MLNSGQGMLDDILHKSIAALDITYEEYLWAVARYEDVGHFLCAYWGDTAGGLVYPQGSIRLGTVTRIVHRNDEYDLDAVCRRDLVKESITQAGLKEDVGDGLEFFVKSDPPANPELDDEGRRCWTLKYPRRPFHLDILPALPDPEGPENGILLTDRSYRRWRQSNPIDYAGWFSGVMSKEFEEKRAVLAERMNMENVPPPHVKTTLQRAVQALKRHRDLYFKDALDRRPPSVIITTLAARAYQGPGDLYEVVRNIATRMPSLVQNEGGVPIVLNPVQPKENFADRWVAEPWRASAFFEWMERAAQDFAGIGAELGLHRIVTKVGAAFGDRSAEAASKGVGLDLYNTRLEGKLGMTAGAGTLIAGGGRPVPNHNFRGDC